MLSTTKSKQENDTDRFGGRDYETCSTVLVAKINKQKHTSKKHIEKKKEKNSLKFLKVVVKSC